MTRIRFMTQYYNTRLQRWIDFGITYDSWDAALAVVHGCRKERPHQLFRVDEAEVRGLPDDQPSRSQSPAAT